MSSSQPPNPQGPQGGQWAEQPLYGPPGPPGSPPPAYPPSGMAALPGTPGASPDRNRGIALAGLIVGVSALAALIGTVLLFPAGYRILPFVLFLISVPASVVGVVLSSIGRQSTTRRGVALTGLIVSIITLVLIVMLMVLIIIGFVVFARRRAPIPFP